MTSLRHLLAAASLPALALACATGGSSYRVQADVRSLRSGSHDASGISAVAGADVALKCPDAAASRELGKTDAEGGLKVEGDGSILLTCKLSIAQAGYVTSELSVASFCTETSMGACRTLAVRAILSVDRGANTATR